MFMQQPMYQTAAPKQAWNEHPHATLSISPFDMRFFSITNSAVMKIFAAFSLALSLLGLARAEEPDDSRIINQVLQTRAAILNRTGNTNAVFLAFWDFDGTTLKDDCSIKPATAPPSAADKNYSG
jgi:hypothetical protein